VGTVAGLASIQLCAAAGGSKDRENSAGRLNRAARLGSVALPARLRQQIPGLLLLAACLVPGHTGVAFAYSVLTHEAIIDSVWQDEIQPLLLTRFPQASLEELRKAHAFAYGGALTSDLGYHPFGSKFFSNLIHYVRSGDFIETMLRLASDVNEYAFALGAVAHYAADNQGHRIAVNPAVPILYPKKRWRNSSSVTYAESPSSHLKTEFAFDVVQVARGNYASDDYRKYIGFEVSAELVQKAFLETYGFDLKSEFSDFDLAIGSFRRAVSVLIPKMTRVGWMMKKNEIQKTAPATVARETFLFNLSRTAYEQQWGKRYRQPGFGTRVLAFLIRILPKVGPLRALAFRVPTPETEQMFMESFNASVAEYRVLLRQTRLEGRPRLANGNFDTGTVTRPGEYPLADETYAELVHRLAESHFARTTPELRSVILAYYSEPQAPLETRKHKKEWSRLMREIEILKTIGLSGE
jgi:hypothetical protein